MKRPPLGRRTPLRPVSSKRRSLSRDYAKARLLVFDRAQGSCEIGSGVCKGVCEQIHHRRGRVGSDMINPALMFATCEPCHSYAHAHPAESYLKGWLLRRTGGTA